MNTTLDQSLLRTIVMVCSWRGDAVESVQACLLLLALNLPEHTCDASMVPGELVNGDAHVSGIATAALITIGLLEVCGRVKSGNPAANGRKVNLLRIPGNRYGAARAWLADRGFMSDEPQMKLRMIV